MKDETIRNRQQDHGQYVRKSNKKRSSLTDQVLKERIKDWSQMSIEQLLDNADLSHAFRASMALDQSIDTAEKADAAYQRYGRRTIDCENKTTRRSDYLLHLRAMLLSELDEQDSKTWFLDVDVKRLYDRTLYLTVEHGADKTHIEKHYLTVLQSAVQRAFGEEVKLELHCRSERKKKRGTFLEHYGQNDFEPAPANGRPYRSNTGSACAEQLHDLEPMSVPLASVEGLEVVEVSGAIKWFDISKGFGFIAPDNGLPDVLLHITCLRAGGYQTACEGVRINCLAINRPKGMQAFRILSLEDSTASDLPQLPSRTHIHVAAESDWERAVVKWFNPVRGFGFLTCGEGTPDIFVHLETLRRYGFTELRPGQVLEVRYGQGSKGVMAAELRPADKSGPKTN